MADKKRDPLETRDMTIKRLITQHEKWNRTVCTSEKRREIEKHVEKNIMPKTIYGKDLK